MNTFCPISTNKIDENIARINGALTLITIILFLISNSLVPILLLIIDFTLRSAELPKYSLFANISKKVKSLLSIESRIVNSGPKIFAARIGLVFSVLISISFLLKINELTLTLSVIFGICALLESALGFCVACKIYPLVYKFIYNK